MDCSFDQYYYDAQGRRQELNREGESPPTPHPALLASTFHLRDASPLGRITNGSAFFTSASKQGLAGLPKCISTNASEPGLTDGVHPLRACAASPPLSPQMRGAQNWMLLERSSRACWAVWAPRTASASPSSVTGRPAPSARAWWPPHTWRGSRLASTACGPWAAPTSRYGGEGRRCCWLLGRQGGGAFGCWAGSGGAAPAGASEPRLGERLACRSAAWAGGPTPCGGAGIPQ